MATDRGLDWWECRLHEEQSRHTVRWNDAVGVAERLSNGTVPAWAGVAAAERSCAEKSIAAGVLDERLVVDRDRINTPVRS